MNTGFMRMGRPPLGSWLLYGLGSPSENLPGYVVMKNGPEPDGGSSNWSNGFLPSEYQGVLLRSEGPPILNLDNPAGLTPAAHRRSLGRHGRIESQNIIKRSAIRKFWPASPTTNWHFACNRPRRN